VLARYFDRGRLHPLSLESRVQMLHVPFRGAAEAPQSVLGNNTTSLWDTSGANAGAIKAGTLKALAVSSPERVAALPDVPTLREAGFPGSVSTNWFVLAAPAGPDPAIGARLNEVVQVPEARHNHQGTAGAHRRRLARQPDPGRDRRLRGAGSGTLGTGGARGRCAAELTLRSAARRVHPAAMRSPRPTA